MVGCVGAGTDRAGGVIPVNLVDRAGWETFCGCTERMGDDHDHIPLSDLYIPFFFIPLSRRLVTYFLEVIIILILYTS